MFELADKDLNIYLVGKLDVANTEKNIDSALKKLDVDDIKISLDINESSLKVVKELSNAIKSVNKILTQQNEILKNNTKLEKESASASDKKAKSSKNETDNIEKQTEALKKLNAEQSKLAKKTTNLNPDGSLKNKTETYKDDNFKTINVTKDKDDKVENVQFINNFEQREKAVKKVADAIEGYKNKLKELRSIGVLADKQLNEFEQTVNSISKDANGIRNLEQAYKSLLNTQRMVVDANQKIADSEKKKQDDARKYENWWQKALIDQDKKTQKAQNKTTSDNRKAQEKEYSDWWNGALKAQESEHRALEETYNIKARIRRLEEEQLEKERQQTRELKEQLDLYKRQEQRRIETLRNKVNNSSFNDVGAKEQSLKSLNDLSNQINNLNTSTPNLSSRMRNLKQDISDVDASVKSSSKSMISFGEAFNQAMTKFPIWMAASTAFYQSLHFFTEGVRYVYDLNKALTEISIVTNQTQQEVNELGLEYRQLAIDMGVTTKEIAQGAVEFYRQGLTATEVMDRMAVTTQYAKISNLEFKESAEIMTATVNSMGISIERASDVFAYLGDATATGADEIGQAFQRVGGTAGALGIEFEKVASWIAEISSRTRESSYTVGNAVKSIIARIQSLKENGFDEEDGTKVNQVAKALAEVGVQLIDEQGNFRDFGKVMDELGARWEGLSSRQKAYVATTVAGSYQQARFLTLMKNYSSSVDLYNEALGSAGTTTQKFGQYQEGMEAHLNKLISTFTGIWQKVFDSEGLKSGIDLLTTIAGSVEDLIDTFGALPLAITAVVVAMNLFGTTARTNVIANGLAMGNTLKNLVTSLMATKTGLLGVNANLLATNTSVRLLSFSFAGLGKAARTAMAFIAGVALPVAGFMLLSVVIEKLITYFSELKQKQEEIKRQDEISIQNLSTKRTQINSLIGEYEKLKKAQEDGTLGAEGEQELLDVQNKLGELVPHLVQSFNEKGEAQLKSVDAVKEEIKYVDQLKKKYDELKVEDFKQKAKESMDAIEKLRKKAESLENPQIYVDPNSGMIFEETQKERIERELQYAQVQKQISEETQKYADDVRDVGKALINNTSAYNDLNSEAKTLVDNLIKTKEVNPTEDQSVFFENIKKQTQMIADAQGYIEKFSDPKDKDTLKLLLSSVRDRLSEVVGGSKEADKIIDSLLSKNKTDTAQSIDLIAQTEKKLSDAYKETSEQVEPLNKLLQDMAEGKEITADQAMELVEKEGDLINAITIENGVVKINTDLVRQMRDEKIKAYQESAEAAKIDIQNQQARMLSNLQSYYEEIKGIKSLAEARNLLAKKMMDAQNTKSGGNYHAIAELSGQMVEIDRLDQLMAEVNKKIELGSAALKTFGTSQTKDKGSKNNFIEEQFKDLGDYEERLKDVLNKTKEINQVIDDTQSQIDTTENVAEQIALQEQLLDLMTKRADLYKEMGQSMQDLKSEIEKTFNKEFSGLTKNSLGAMSEAEIKKINDDFEKKLTSLNNSAGKATKDSVKTYYQKQVKDIENDKELFNALVSKFKAVDDAIIENNNNLRDENGAIEKLKSTIKGLELDEMFKAMDEDIESSNDKIDEMNYQLDRVGDGVDKLSQKGDLIASLAGEYDSLAEKIRNNISLMEAEQQTLTVGSDAWEKNKDKIKEYQDQLVQLSRAKDALQDKLKQIIADSLREEKDEAIDELKKEFEETIERLKGLIEEDDSYDPRKRMYDKARAERRVQKAEGEHLTEEQMDFLQDFFPDSAEEAMKNMDEYDDKIKKIADSVDDFQDKSSKNMGKLENIIESEIESANELKEQIKEANDELELRKLIYEEEEAELERQIDLIQKQREEILKTIEEARKEIVEVDLGDIADQLNDVFDGQDFFSNLFGNIKDSVSTGEISSGLGDIVSSLEGIYSSIGNLNVIDPNDKDALISGINKEIELSKQLNELQKKINDEIRDRQIEYKRIEEDKQRQIDEETKMYDEQIAQQEEKLNLLEEQYEAEDRLIKLREIEDEINKTRSDKRFSYITKDGEEILTYNKGRVEELEKQRDEMKQQFEREDIKKAIQDEIDRLKQAKEDRIKILEEELEQMKKEHQKQLDALNVYLNAVGGMHTLIEANLNTHVEQLGAVYDKMLADKQAELDKMKELHQAELEALELYIADMEDLYDDMRADIDEKLQALKELQDEHVTEQEEYWDALIENAGSSTETLNSTLNNFYDGSLTSVKTYRANFQSEVNALIALYSQLANLQANPPSTTPVVGGGSGSGGSSGGSGGSGGGNGSGASDGSLYGDGNVDWIGDASDDDDKDGVPNIVDHEDNSYKGGGVNGGWQESYYNPPSRDDRRNDDDDKPWGGKWRESYHEGGTYTQDGSPADKYPKLVNDLFDLKKNEGAIKVLDQETMIPPQKAKNIVTTMSKYASLVSSRANGDTIIKHEYNLRDVVIRANDADELFESIQFLVNSEKK